MNLCDSRFLLIITAFAALGSNHVSAQGHEVWVAPGTNAPGTAEIRGSGAIGDPLTGDFDAVVGSQGSNATIHLLPGTYRAGFIELKLGQKLMGGGMEQTVVRQDEHRVAESLMSSSSDDVEVSDLTIDCNGTDADEKKRNGLCLTGNNCTARRVKVVRASGNVAHDQESFAFFVGSPASVGNSVSDCEVSDMRGNYCTAFFMSGQGVVRFNRAYLPTFINDESHQTAYSTAGSRNALFIGNFSMGGRCGFQTDTWGETNLTIAENTFRNVHTGVGIAKFPGHGWEIDGVAVVNNTIELQTNPPHWLGNWDYGIALRNNDESGRERVRNISITGNRIRYIDNGTSTEAGAIGLSVTAALPTNSNLTNVRITANTLDRSFLIRLNGRGNWLADNMDLDGLPLHFVELGDGSPRLPILSVVDSQVWVTSTNVFAIGLPPSDGFPGKEVVIVNQRRAKLKIYPTGLEHIKQSEPATLRGNHTARFFSDGSGLWMREQ